MKLNKNFKKNKWNGYCDALEFEKWYEPILAYPIGFFFGFFMMIPFFGTKLFCYLVYCDSEIERKNKKKEYHKGTNL